MSGAISQELLWYGYWKRKNVTITVNPTPSDATVTLTSTGYTQVGNSITLPIGATLKVKVTKSPTYNDYDPPAFVVTGPNTMNVELSSAPTGVLSVTPMPSDSVVTLTAPGCVQNANSITVPLGTTVHCVVSPNNSANLLESSTDIQVVQPEQSATLYCNARVTIIPTPSDSVATITYAGRTYSNMAVVPYNSRISWSVSRADYDTRNASNVAITANTEISVELQKTMVVFSVTPFIKNTYAPNATVSLVANDESITPVTGQGTQEISIPVGTSVTYVVSQQNYDTTEGVAENIVSSTNINVTISAHSLGIKYFTSNGSWTVPTNDNYKMAVITNGGNGGAVQSIKQIGGTGGGASGNSYVVDLGALTEGQILGFNFGTSNVVITKDSTDFLSYPNGGNGVSGNPTSVTYNGTNGGSATAGNGGGAGSGGAKLYSVSIPQYRCLGSSCRQWMSVTWYRGTIAAAGDGGNNGNSGSNGGTSTIIGSTYSNGGVGGTGFNATKGGANNGGVYPQSNITDTVPGTPGLAGLGASSSQLAIETRIKSGTLTSDFLRSLITAAGGGVGGIYKSNADYTSDTSILPPSTGGGGGAWTNGTDGNNVSASVKEATFSTIPGGTGGHGVIIIWRPADYE